MFSSPAVRIFSQENVDNAPRKPGTNTESRKPFSDRTVNGPSPDIDRNLKTELLKEVEPQSETQTPFKLDTEEEDLFFYDTFSYNDVEDHFADICLKHMKQKDTFNILCSYSNYYGLKTPPPELSPDIDIFIKPLKFNFKDLDEDVKKELLEESFEDVSVPVIDFDI